jgi:FkbM family methyltransferase
VRPFYADAVALRFDSLPDLTSAIDALGATMDILRTCRRLVPRSIALPLLAELRARRDVPELRLIACLGHRDRALVDVGANIGLYAYVGTKHFRHVYAVEPHPAAAQVLRRTFGSKVSVLECAFSDHAGTLPLFVPTREGREITSRGSLDITANTGFAQRDRLVRVQRLDDLDIDDVHMIKIDVEGHELCVIKGAVNTIETQHPFLLIEIEERHHPGKSMEVINFISELSYHGYFVMGRRLYDMADFSFDRYQRAENAKSPGGRRSQFYVNNFLFLPRSGDHIDKLRRAGFL